MPSVVIDGRAVEVTAGSNLLAAARKLEIEIPALCYHPACAPHTACMLCVVKLRDPDRIAPACATPATDGLVVESETPEIHALRRTNLELLLSDHVGLCDAACPAPRADADSCTCGKEAVCRLRKYARIYSADPGRFAGPRRSVPRAYEHPEITYDPAKCILCGICVSLSQQAGENPGLTFVGRGFETRVDVPLDGSLADALHHAARRIAGACPTSALAPKPGRS